MVFEGGWLHVPTIHPPHTQFFSYVIHQNDNASNISAI